MSVADKLRAARRIEIKVGELTFFGMRATHEQLANYGNLKFTDAQVCRLHIDGWAGVKESDVFDGGSKEVLKFSREDFGEAIGEKPEWCAIIVSEVIKDAVERHSKRTENEKK